MSTLRESVIRLWETLRRTRTDRDLEEELRLHLELAGEDARRRSGPPDPHLRAATIRAVGVAQAMEALRDQRGLPWLQDLVGDLRYGCRMLARNPGFTVVAVLSLAIGIGANTAVFSFADTLLLRPLTVPRPSEVLTVGSTSPSTIRPILLASYRDDVDVRDRSQSFEGLVAFTHTVVGFASEPDTLPKLTIGMLERAYPDTNRNQTITARTELQARIAAAPPIARLLLMLNLLAVIGGVLGLGVGDAGVTMFRQFQIPTDLPIVVVATFIYRGFQQQLGNGPGFRTDHLLMMSLAPTQLHDSESQAEQFFERVAEQARRVPGVQSAALTRFMPMDGLPPSVTIIPEGFQFPAGKDSATVAGSIVSCSLRICQPGARPV